MATVAYKTLLKQLDGVMNIDSEPSLRPLILQYRNNGARPEEIIFLDKVLREGNNLFVLRELEKDSVAVKLGLIKFPLP